jgi:hypothetical protein
MFVIHYQTKEKWKNNITCPITILLLLLFSYGNGFVLKWKDYYAFVVQKMKKHIFW